jgi:hypothetical protein
MGSWPEGVPLPPKPVKPEGITQVEWEIYQNCDPQKIDPRIRDKVEAAMGWKKDDVADAREIAEQVLGAVKIAETQSPTDAQIAARLRSYVKELERVDRSEDRSVRRVLRDILDGEPNLWATLREEDNEHDD